MNDLSSAIFLRIPGAKDKLDSSSVHPESYDAAKALLELCGYTVKDAANGKLGELKEKIEALGTESVAEKIGVDKSVITDEWFIGIREPHKLMHTSEEDMQELYEKELPVFDAIVKDISE